MTDNAGRRNVVQISVAIGALFNFRLNHAIRIFNQRTSRRLVARLGANALGRFFLAGIGFLISRRWL